MNATIEIELDTGDGVFVYVFDEAEEALDVFTALRQYADREAANVVRLFDENQTLDASFALPRVVIEQLGIGLEENPIHG